jgi:DNA (cytosine-5)-methyltransferase 1
MKKYTVVDLFSGCGGLSLGFQQTNKFEIIAGVDNYTDALKTFEMNHKGALALNLDLFDQNFTDELKNKLKGRTVDVVVGGPPCQGFSVTGPRNFDDKRNTLYLSMIKAVEDLNPKAFLIENVPGLATMYNGQVKDEILKRFDKLGYDVNNKVLLAANYGVPQTRKRVFFVGIKRGLGDFNFPEPILSPENYISTSDAVSDLPTRENDHGLEVDDYGSQATNDYQKLMRSSTKKLYNHVSGVHGEKVTNVISLVPDGGNYKDLPEGIGDHRKFNVAWTRYNSKKPSSTIDTGHRNHFHYKWNRVPTVRENARFQSFPDDFIFYGSRTSQYRQVGNAVPPILAEAVANQIFEAIRKDA